MQPPFSRISGLDISMGFAAVAPGHRLDIDEMRTNSSLFSDCNAIERQTEQFVTTFLVRGKIFSGNPLQSYAHYG